MKWGRYPCPLRQRSVSVRIKIDCDLCQGHGLCVATAPELFEFQGDDMQPTVLRDPVPEELQEDAVTAVDCCPERAISIE